MKTWNGIIGATFAAIVVLSIASAHGDHPDIPDQCEHDCLHRVYEPCARSCKSSKDANACWMGCVRLHHECFEGCHK